jgi:Tfp pilus assembly protein PilV
VHSPSTEAVPRTDWRPRGEAGFSLLEVVIGFSLVTVAVLTILQVMLTSSIVDEETREVQIAVKAAEGKVEEILAYDYQGDIDDFIAHWTSAQYNTFTVPALTAPTATEANPQAMHGAITIDSADPLLVRMTVTVNWTSRRGQRPMSVASAITEVTP